MPSANGHGPKHVVLYARRSDRKDNFSIAGQLKELREHAHAQGHEIAEEVQDPWAKRWTLDRPGVERIRELALLGGVDEVWAWRWDRFGESPWPEVLQLELDEYGVRLRSLDDSGEGEDAELLNGLKGLMAKRERRRIAERSRMGKLQKAHEGRLVASKAPAYGFDFNETRDGYVVNGEQMRVVRRIFEWVAINHLSITGVVNRLKDEGVPSPSGVGRWDRGQIRNMVNSDLYKPHTKEELIELGVAPNVVATLPEGLYGVVWYGKRRVKLKGKALAEVTKKDPKEWIPVPVVDGGLDRDLVEAARLAIVDNVATSKNAARFWELSGGIAYCRECGRRMLASTRKRPAPTQDHYFYYVCQRGRYSRDVGCSHNRHHPAKELETLAFEQVRAVLSDPDLMRAGLRELVASETAGQERDRSELAHWTEALQNVELKTERLLDLYLDGGLERALYEEKIVSLRAEERSAREEVERLKTRRQMVETAQRDVEALIEDYAEAVPEDLDDLTPEERYQIYKMLGLRVGLDNTGAVEISGVVRIPKKREHINSGCRYNVVALL
jgi:site-specific DNA recombinase